MSVYTHHYEICDTRFVRRYSMTNLLYWLRDRKSTGLKLLSVITPLVGDLWSAYLAESSRLIAFTCA